MTDARDRSDAVIVRFAPINRATRRLRFEPRSEGNWTRVEEVWSRDSWRAVGTETVESIGFEGVTDDLLD